MACFNAWDIGACGCAPSGVICSTCTPAGIPTTLSVTDSAGTYTATWNSGTARWTTSQLCSGTVSPVANCNSGTAACRAGTQSGNTIYYYSIICTSANHMTMYRYWYELTCASPSYQYQPCSCALNAQQALSSSGSVAVTCGSIAWSGTLTPVPGGHHMADPVGGTTSFTQ